MWLDFEIKIKHVAGWTDFEIKTASHDLSTATVNGIDRQAAAAGEENKLNFVK